MSDGYTELLGGCLRKAAKHMRDACKPLTDELDAKCGSGWREDVIFYAFGHVKDSDEHLVRAVLALTVPLRDRYSDKWDRTLMQAMMPLTMMHGMLVSLRTDGVLYVPAIVDILDYAASFEAMSQELEGRK